MSDKDNASSTSAKHIYLDLCALNRPLDDQRQIRVRLEADAVSLILGHVRVRTIRLAVSPVHFADAAHAAYAEMAGCDFVTVDDRLLRQLHRGRLRVWSGTPMAYCDKENLR